MKMLTITSCIVLSLTLSASAKTVAADDLKKTFIGKKLSFVTKDGFTGNVRYKHFFKRAKLYNANFEPSRDKGKWWIEGNKICNQWKVTRGGSIRCSSYTKIGDNKYRANSTGAIVTVH